MPLYNPTTLDAELEAIAALTSAADKGIEFTGVGTAATYDLTTFAKTILDDANQAAVQATLGVVPGTNVQTQDAELAAIAGLTSAANKGIQFTGSGTAGTFDLTAFAKTVLDDADAATALATLGAQPVDSDLTSIAALSTTSYGRALLTLANAAAADWVTKALYDANSILIATSDDTPIAMTVAASRVVGRKASGDIDDMTAAETAAVLGTNVYGQVQTVNAQTGTTYTLVAGDAGLLVSLSNGSAITLTLPQDSDATIAIGTYIDLYQLGAGQVTTAAGTGATLRTSGLTAKARAQYSRFAVQKVSANTWSLFGDLASS